VTRRSHIRCIRRRPRIGVEDPALERRSRWYEVLAVGVARAEGKRECRQRDADRRCAELGRVHLGESRCLESGHPASSEPTFGMRMGGARRQRRGARHHERCDAEAVPRCIPSKDRSGCRWMLLVHWHCSGRTPAAGRRIAQAYVEPNRIETGFEDNELFARQRDAVLSEPDECGADTLASGLRRDVEPFDGVVGSMDPTDNRRVKQGNPDFIIRNGALHTRSPTVPGPALRLAR
jgi:hypothetical protein